jgi:hypothetical protein
MKALTISVFLCIFLVLSCADEEARIIHNLGVIPQDSSVIIPVVKQLDAYNARDINRFIPNFSENIKLYRMGSNEPFCNSRNELTEIYTNLFQSKPELNCKLVSRMVCVNYVIDEELVTGLETGRELRAIAIYQIKDSLIDKAWFIKDK